MRRLFVPLVIAGALLAGGTTAHADEVSFGASNGTVGFTFAHWTNGPVTDPDNHHIDHYCNFAIAGVGNDVTITIYAEATSGPHAVAVSTGIYCEVRDRNGAPVYHVAVALPGTHASIVGTSGLVSNNGPYTVCSQGTGQWVDTHLYATPLRCQAPNLPVVG